MRKEQSTGNRWTRPPTCSKFLSSFPFLNRTRDDRMPVSIEHERMRWASMTQRQLSTRLKRITKREKLENFLQIAISERDDFLIGECINRSQILGFRDSTLYESDDVTPHPVFPQPVPALSPYAPPLSAAEPKPEKKRHIIFAEKKPIRKIRISGGKK